MEQLTLLALASSLLILLLLLLISGASLQLRHHVHQVKQEIVFALELLLDQRAICVLQLHTDTTTVGWFARFFAAVQAIRFEHNFKASIL